MCSCHADLIGQLSLGCNIFESFIDLTAFVRLDAPVSVCKCVCVCVCVCVCGIAKPGVVV
jgi:hypothetical protein